MQLFYVITIYFYQHEHTARATTTGGQQDLCASKLVLAASTIVWGSAANPSLNALDASGCAACNGMCRVECCKPRTGRVARKWHVCAKSSSRHFRPITDAEDDLIFVYVTRPPTHTHAYLACLPRCLRSKIFFFFWEDERSPGLLRAYFSHLQCKKKLAPLVKVPRSFSDY